MIDPQLLREKTETVAKLLKRRGFEWDVEAYIALEGKRKALQITTQQLQNERNQLSKAIGIAKSRGEDIEPTRLKVNRISEELEASKIELEKTLRAIESMALQMPNIPDDSVPTGKDETQNIEVRRWGQAPNFDFVPLSHDALGEAIGQLDFETAAKITGSRFVVIRNQLAKLHRALIQFMLDVHTEEHGYQEIYVPYIINAHSLFGTGQLPKLAEDLFRLEGEQAYYLTPTAEVPVTNTVRDQIIQRDKLPLKFVCHSPCFRSEAGSYGRDTKGMIRQHQFEKVELVWITTPDASFESLEVLTSHAERILQKLNLPYRVMSLCTGDIGNSSAKTYDLEVWLPSQNTYREISSCSNMTSFQARRMKTRFRDAQGKDTELVHTLNGSGLAIGRTLVAIMENYQDKQGNIHIPEILQPYMKGESIIK